MLQEETPTHDAPLPTASGSDTSSPSPAVYLETSWTTTSASLRHPALRLLNCAAHFVVTFFLCASSPLASSLHAPARFPVYGKWAAVWCSQLTWEKALVHSALAVLLVLLLRFVVFRKWVAPHWYRQQRRYGHTAAYPLKENLLLVTHTPTTLDAHGATTRAQLQTNGASQKSHGSWTFVALSFPFLWSIVAEFVHWIVQDSAMEARLFGKGSAATNMAQWKVQALVYQVLMTLSALKLLLTLDVLLQDTHYARHVYANWFVRVRRAYVTYPVVRILVCWSFVAQVFVLGVHLNGFEWLQRAWLALNLSGNTAEALQPWFSNESWNMLLGGVVVSLDLLWIVQDYGFPVNGSNPKGVHIFGLWKDTVSIGGERSLTSFTSAGVPYFIVLAMLLPVELCHFVQLVTYTPAAYDQYVDSITHRVFPLLVMGSSNSSIPLEALQNSSEMKLLLQQGSISRYFAWSVWERVPACALILFTLLTILWIWRHERVKLRQVRPHQHGAMENSSTVNATLPSSTKQTLAKQTRLRELYTLRAHIDTNCIILAALSVAAVVLQFRSIWRSHKSTVQDDAAVDDDDDDDVVFLPLQFPGEAYGVVLLGLTCALVYQLHRRYRVKLQLLVLRNELPPPRNISSVNASLWHSPRRLLVPFLVELVLCSICLPPFLHADLSLQETRYELPRFSTLELSTCPRRMTMSDATHHTCELKYTYPLEIINMVVLVRLYWFLRIIRNRLQQKVVAADQPLLVVSGVFQDVPLDSLSWSFKIAFKLAPKELLVVLFLCFWAGTAAAVSIFERPFPSLLDNEEHSLWLAIVTMSTVGYGDAYPMTAYGRVSIFLGAVVGGAILMSLITSVFLDAVKGSKVEHHVVATMERVAWQKKMWTTSAELIATAWQRYQLHHKSGGDSDKANLRADRHLFSLAHQFKVLRKLQKPKETYDTMEALKMSAMAHWRAQELSAWIAESHQESKTNLDMLEHQVDAVENAFKPCLVTKRKKTWSKQRKSIVIQTSPC
ncbi:Voltage-gated ion channel, partial [Globisporangium splendens]